YAARAAAAPTDRWFLDTIDSAGNDVGEFPSLAINPLFNRPVVTYRDNANTSLKIARLLNGSWQSQVLDGTQTNVGNYTALAIDPLGTLHIAYADVGRARLRYFQIDRMGAGRPVDVDGMTAAGTFNAIAANAQGDTAISTFAATEEKVHAIG